MIEIDHKKVVKIMAEHRITLPKDWIEKWNMKKGDLIEFQEIPDTKQLRIIPVIVVPRNSVKVIES